MKNLLLLMFVCLLTIGSQAQKKVKIDAVGHGYNGRVVDFEFIDSPENNMQFPFKDNQLMSFEVELKEPSLMKINTWLWLIVCPGDEIQMDITFQGKNIRSVEYKGTPAAVALNSAISEGRTFRLNNRYKTNPLAAAITQVPVLEYYKSCQSNWAKEQEILGNVKGQVEPFAYNYIYAELEGMYLSNLVRYPFIIADVTKKDIKQCLPENFWNVLDGYQIKSDKASLKSMAYVGWLIDYKEYQDKAVAAKEGKAYEGPKSMEDMYERLAETYEDNVRDAVLYLFLYNAISSQQDFEMIHKLSKDYFKKYNKDKKYKKVLTEMQK